MATYFRIGPRTLKKSLLRASFSKNLQVSDKGKKQHTQQWKDQRQTSPE